MRRIPYYIVDVFTDSPLGGNPLAVYPDRSQLKESELQKIAAEMNLSETVFVEEPTRAEALKRLRIFTPRAELPLAGHPVIGTWFLLASEGLVDFKRAEAEKKAYVVKSKSQPEKVIFQHELAVGVLPVAFYRNRGQVGGVVMDQDQPKFSEKIEDVSLIADALGLDAKLITGSMMLPMAVNTGMWILMVPVATSKALASARPDPALFEKIVQEYGVTGAYAFTRDTSAAGKEVLIDARGFFPTLGIMEDPATGSAAGCLGCYLVKNQIIKPEKKQAFQIEQGRDMGRISRIGVEVTVSDGEISRIRVGGSAVVTARAEMYLP